MNDNSMQILMQQAQALLEQKRMAEAHDMYQKICKQDPTNETAWMMLGNLNGALGNMVDAEKCSRKAIELNSKLVNAHANLGNALLAQNKYKDAAVSFSEASRLQPDLAPAWYMLGKTQEKLGQWSEAEVALRKAVELNPGWLDARLLLGKVLQFMGHFQDAGQQYELIIQSQANHAEAHYRLAVSLSSMGKTHESEASFRRALELQPEHIPALNALSLILLSHGQTSEALECCERALAIKPDDIDAICMISNVYEHLGEAQKAYEYLQPHIEAGTQHINLALAFAAISKELGFEEQAIEMMEDLLERVPGLSNTSRRNLCFILGKLCDGIKQYDRAFEHFRRGNELRPTRFNPDNFKKYIENHIRIQTTDFFNKAQKSSNKSDRPIFIVGMPRSGTSLVEQILASHPMVYGAGELAEIGMMCNGLKASLNADKHYPELLDSISRKDLNQCANQYLKHLKGMNTDSLRVVDKMPSNFFCLGLINLIFPNARVIHCMRNPLDTCLSCYFQDFFQSTDWCYEQENLISYYRGYEKLMNHWKLVLDIPMMDVSYEELVSDQENISRKLIEFCGLDWMDDCLQFHKAKRLVSTASYDQVRKPIYKKSVARWKNYRKHIGLLIEEFNNDINT